MFPGTSRIVDIRESPRRTISTLDNVVSFLCFTAVAQSVRDALFGGSTFFVVFDVYHWSLLLGLAQSLDRFDLGSLFHFRLAGASSTPPHSPCRAALCGLPFSPAPRSTVFLICHARPEEFAAESALAFGCVMVEHLGCGILQFKLLVHRQFKDFLGKVKKNRCVVNALGGVCKGERHL